MLDAIIIGAGFSGIAAAKQLSSKEKSFLLLEARERPGGRIHTRFYEDGSYLELGGQWIGPTQDRMYLLALEYGLEWFETYNKGINLMDLSGKIKSYNGLIPKLDWISLINLELMIRKMERMADRVKSDAPWTTENAQKWDQITLEAFVQQHKWTKQAYAVIKAGLETVFACELNEISLLHALFYMKSGTSLQVLLSIENGAQLHRIKGGIQPLAEKIISGFASQVRYSEPIIRIIQENNSIRILTERNEYLARKVILAIPPAVYQRISFEPELPLPKRQLVQKISLGIAGKIFFIYKTPFWRKKGFSGQVVADACSPFQTFFDVSPADAAYGVLMAFSLANRARAYFDQPKSAREALAVQWFSRYFGAECKDYVRYEDHCWAEEVWSGGCYAGVYPTGAWTNFQGLLAAKAGNLHFAGTETSSVWYGYIEGAVRAGERAAMEIITG